MSLFSIEEFLDNTDRLGTSVGKAGKPTLAICKSFHVWLLNPGTEAMSVEPGELFGFGTGAYATVVLSHSLMFWPFGNHIGYS